MQPQLCDTWRRWDTLAAQPGLILSCVYACIYVCNRNVWRFDEGLASRVPYESSARTLTQSRETFTGYTVRQGLAITLEHNFMMSPAGMQNFESQIKQVCRARLRVCNAFFLHMKSSSALPFCLSTALTTLP